MLVGRVGKQETSRTEPTIFRLRHVRSHWSWETKIRMLLGVRSYINQAVRFRFIENHALCDMNVQGWSFPVINKLPVPSSGLQKMSVLGVNPQNWSVLNRKLPLTFVQGTVRGIGSILSSTRQIVESGYRRIGMVIDSFSAARKTLGRRGLVFGGSDHLLHLGSAIGARSLDLPKSRNRDSDVDNRCEYIHHGGQRKYQGEGNTYAFVEASFLPLNPGPIVCCLAEVAELCVGIVCTWLSVGWFIFMALYSGFTKSRVRCGLVVFIIGVFCSQNAILSLLKGALLNP